MGRKRPHHGNTRRGSGKGAKRRPATLVGTLLVHSPGVAEVETPEGTFPVARRGLREAMNGDTVQVSVAEAHGPGRGRGGRGAGAPGSGLVAYVQGVLVRAVETFVGRFDVAGPLGVVAPLDARLGHDFFVLPEDTSAAQLGVAAGDVVRARITEYPTRNSGAVCTIERRLGTTDELDLNVEAVIASHGLATEFPPSALAQAEGIRADVQGALDADASRQDLRDLVCVTIDPTDARDFDDAVGARRLGDGGFEVWVHIADVTHYVGWETPIDNEAKRRTCSVYLVDRVLPMLPERLCNDVCSLVPGEDRLAMSVRMRLDARGRVTSAKAMTSAIRSSARLTYDQVLDFLEGRAPVGSLPVEAEREAAVTEALGVLDQVRDLRQRVRRARGAIDFETVETRMVLDEAGHPTGVQVRQKTRATSLVEEAMLLANECVADMLAQREVATAYRVHESPAPEDLHQTLLPLKELGLLEGDLQERLVAGEPGAIQEVLAAARGTRGEVLASSLLLRAQKRAVYRPHNEGHYALGARAYCHFTSPIRRYPDDLVHRALKELLAGRADGPMMRRMEAVLPQLCSTCSRMEHTADAAARDSQEVKMAEWYAGRVGERAVGTVTGCERFGLFVTLDETYAEGLVPVRALGAEWFAYDEARMTLTGEESGEAYGLGRRVVVEVTGADPARGRIDFALVR